jgi:tetratricopeptide (TPR) repeat protein
MMLFPRIFSSPERQLKIAGRYFRAGKATRADRAVDSAINVLRKKYLKRNPNTKRLLCDAWFLKGQLQLRAGKREDAFRSFFACGDRVSDDSGCLVFVVRKTLALPIVPIELCPALVSYAANAELRRSQQDYSRIVAHISKLWRPNPQEDGSIEAVEKWNVDLLERASDCAWCRYHVGIIAASRRKWADACTVLQQATTLEPQWEAPLRLYAFVLLQMERSPAALALLKRREGLGSSRGTLLLRAYLETIVGDLSIAAQCYRQANAIRALQSKHRFALAEILVRLGLMTEARQFLAIEIGEISPAARIVWALTLSENGPDADVQNALGAVVKDQQFGEQAAAAVLAIVAEHPHHEGALTSLSVIPIAHRGNRYFMIEGACHFSQRRWKDALFSWSRIKPPDPRFRQAEAVVQINDLIDRYNSGDFLGVVTACSFAQFSDDWGIQADRLCVFALGRLFKLANHNKLDAQIIDSLSRTIKTTPALLEIPNASDLVGAIFAASGRAEQAIEFLRNPQQLDVALIGAGAALRVGDPELAMELLRHFPSTDCRRAQLIATAAAQLRNWDDALAALDADPQNSNLRAAICFLAGRFDELESMGPAGGVTSFFRAVHMLDAGRRESGKAELDRVEIGSPLRADADRLSGWLDLCDAARALRGGNIDEARIRLLAAIRQWPGANGAVAGLSGGDEALMCIMVYANDRAKLQEVFTRAGRQAGFADPKSSHRLAIFHLTQGQIRVRDAQFTQAIAEWEAAIGYIGMVLANRIYMNAWRQARTQTYNFALPPEEDMQAAIVEACTTLFDNTAGQMDATNAEVARLLVSSLEAELHAANLLAQRQGFEIDGLRRVFGPTALVGTNIATEFAEYCLDIAQVEGRRDEDAEPRANPRHDNKRLVGVDEIECYFSNLRLPALLASKGDVERALDYIERDNSICYPLCNMDRCTSGPRNGCSGRTKRFVACNPAFARDGGAEDLRHVALNMQLTLVLKVAEHEIAKNDMKLERLKQLWSKAVELGKVCGRSDAVAERTHKLVFGRIAALGADGKNDVAYEIVRVANLAVPSDDLKSEAARLMTDRAIDLANDANDFESAVKMLREAYGVNPHNPRIRRSLITALRTLSDRDFDANNQRCFGLLREAHDIAAQWVEQDEFNSEPRDIVTSLESQHASYLRKRALEVIEKDRTKAARYLQESVEFALRWSILPKAPTQTRELAQIIASELAAVIAGNAIEIMNDRSGVLREFAATGQRPATNLLRAARMLDPTSTYVAKNLMAILHQRSLAAAELKLGLNVCVDLLNEATLIGELLLRSREDKEIRELTDRISRDLKALFRVRPDLARSPKWRDPAALQVMTSPTLEDGMRLLRKEKLP